MCALLLDLTTAEAGKNISAVRQLVRNRQPSKACLPAPSLLDERCKKALLISLHRNQGMPFGVNPVEPEEGKDECAASSKVAVVLKNAF